MSPKAPKVRRKRGRPPLPPEEGKRVPLNMRTTQALRDRISAAAKMSGRSTAQEIEHRMEMSFQKEDVLYDRFGGTISFNLMTMLGSLITVIEQQTGKDWLKDRKTYIEVKSAFDGFLDAISPKSTTGKSGLHDIFLPEFSEKAVNNLLQLLLNAATKQHPGK